MITVKFKGLDKLMRDLETARKTAVPYAIRDALNTAAFETRRVWGNEIKAHLVTRNTYTGRSLIVDRAVGLDVRRMKAVVGSVAPYMGDLEEGSTRHGRGRHLPIPTSVSAGLAPGSKRTKLVRASNRLRAIQAAKATSGQSKAQRNAIALSVARRRNEKFAVLERRNGGKGLFRLSRRLAPRMVWDLSRSSVRVPPHETLQPALAKVASKLEAIAMDAVLRQLKRHHLFGH